MKDPAILFYPNDYLGGTLGMTFEEKGAYMELLILQFNRGHMTSHMVGQTVGQLWCKIQHKFQVDDSGLFFNERFEFEQEKRKSYTGSRKNNLLGNNQHTKNDKKRGHMTSHMENENRNRDINEDIILNKKEKFKKFNFRTELLNYGFLENLVDDWLIVRKNKKASNTETSFKTFIKEIESKECEINDMLQIAVSHSWSGFKHDWVENTNGKPNRGADLMAKNDF